MRGVRIYCLTLFVFFSVLYMHSLQSADEPDFKTRIERLARQDIPAPNPLSIVLNDINWLQSVCDQKESLRPHQTGLVISCDDIVVNVVGVKYYILFFNTLFLVLFIFNWRSNVSSDFSIRKRFNTRSIDSIFITLLSPAVIYNLQLASSESFMTLLSLFAFFILSQKNVYYSILYCGFITVLDQGQGYLISIYFVYYTVIYFFRQQENIFQKVPLYGVPICLIALYFYGYDLLAVLAEVTGNTKLLEILSSVDKQASVYYDLSTIWLRPVYTVVSLLFLTANKWYSILYFISLSIFVVLCFVRYTYARSIPFPSGHNRYLAAGVAHLKNIPLKIAFIDIALYSFGFISMVIFVMPTYAFGKYFIFLTPLIVAYISQFLPKRSIILIFVTGNFFIVSEALLINNQFNIIMVP